MFHAIYGKSIRPSLQILLLWTLQVFLTFAASASSFGICHHTLEMVSEGDRILQTTTEGQPRLVRIQVPSAGLLVVEALPGQGTSSLTTFESGCHLPEEDVSSLAAQTPTWTLVEQGSSWQVVALHSAGRMTFLLHPENPTGAWNDLEVRVSFFGAEVTEEWGNRVHRTNFWPAEALKSEEDMVDPDPDATSDLLGEDRPLLTLVTLYDAAESPAASAPTAPKSEEDMVDPDPDARWMPEEAFVLARLVLFPEHGARQIEFDQLERFAQWLATSGQP